jgi:hypothetical protein
MDAEKMKKQEEMVEKLRIEMGADEMVVIFLNRKERLQAGVVMSVKHLDIAEALIESAMEQFKYQREIYERDS